VGRQFIVVAAIALSVIITGSGFAQSPPQNPRFRGDGGDRRNYESRGGRERFFQLSPEERQAFQRNAERWLRMNPEQQKLLRQREQQRRQQMKMEAEAALRQSGLRLDQNARDQFEARYLQERRRIERDLRQEVESKRQQQLPQLNERLKSEFQTHQGSPPASVGAPKSPKR
jgi:superfamily II RNA helicase